MAKHNVITNDEDIATAVSDAAQVFDEPRVERASLAHIDGETLIALKMTDGSRHFIPKSALEDLSAVSDQVASAIEVTDDGFGLRWPTLDLDLYVPHLLQGIYGTKKWMASIGRRGGQARSELKCKAARENGRKGGRPRKSPSIRLESAKFVLQDRRHIATSGHRIRISRHSTRVFAALFSFDDQEIAQPLPRIV